MWPDGGADEADVPARRTSQRLLQAGGEAPGPRVIGVEAQAIGLASPDRPGHRRRVDVHQRQLRRADLRGTPDVLVSYLEGWALI